MEEEGDAEIAGVHHLHPKIASQTGDGRSERHFNPYLSAAFAYEGTGNAFLTIPVPPSILKRPRMHAYHNV